MMILTKLGIPGPPDKIKEYFMLTFYRSSNKFKNGRNTCIEIILTYFIDEMHSSMRFTQVLSPQYKILSEINFPYLLISSQFLSSTGFEYFTFEKQIGSIGDRKG